MGTNQPITKPFPSEGWNHAALLLIFKGLLILNAKND